tara:strand:- start:17 stop:625 length:609 start_codon:yes stop_codon:yes gene_type:complete
MVFVLPTRDCLVYNWIYTGGFNLLKLELHFPNLLKETYIIHRTGGEHPFKHVSTAAPLFKEDCWPYIQRIHWPDTKMNAYKGAKKPKQINLNISFRHTYPYCNLSGIGTREVHVKNRKPAMRDQSQYLKMHVAVARAFIPNPENKPQVLHLNDDPSDYRIENLKWGTNRENHTGRRRDAHGNKDNTLIHAIFRMHGWAQGDK